MVLEISIAAGATALFAFALKYWIIPDSIESPLEITGPAEYYLALNAVSTDRMTSSMDELTQEMRQLKIALPPILRKGIMSLPDISTEEQSAIEPIEISEIDIKSSININRLIIPPPELKKDIDKYLGKFIDAFSTMSDFAKVHETIAKAMLKDPDNTSLYLLDGEAYTREGKADEAYICLKLAERFLPEVEQNHKVIYMKSRIADLRRDGLTAMNYANNLVENFKDNAQYTSLLGFFYWKYKDDIDSAIKYQEMAQAFAKDNLAFKIRGLNNLAYYFASLGSAERAEKEYLEKAFIHIGEIKKMATWDQLTSVLDTIGYVIYRKYTINIANERELLQAYMYVREASKRETDNILVKKHLADLAKTLNLPGPDSVISPVNWPI